MCKSFLLQVLPEDSYHVRLDIVVHWEETRTSCTRLGSNNGFKDFNGRRVTIFLANKNLRIPPADGRQHNVCQSLSRGTQALVVNLLSSLCVLSFMKSVLDCLGGGGGGAFTHVAHWSHFCRGTSGTGPISTPLISSMFWRLCRATH